MYLLDRAASLPDRFILYKGNWLEEKRKKGKEREETSFAYSDPTA